MATLPERVRFNRSQIDVWSTREKLCLASAVVRSGDQNWMSVSRVMKPYAEPGRPPDWFSQRNCAVQYAVLLENAEMPKRKKRNISGEKKDVDETPGQSILRMLTQERVEELNRSMAAKRVKYLALKEEIAMISSGQEDHRLEEIAVEVETEKKQKLIDAENHSVWLKEREERKAAQLERVWKPPPVIVSSLKRKLPMPPRDHRRNSSQSEQSSEAESAVNSPLNEPLNVDILGEESTDTKPSIPIPTPTSPLLTSLLKTPSPAVTTPQTSSILHNAITSQRDSSPTIASLLSSSPGVPHIGVPQLHSAKTSTHVQPSVGPSSAGAPTLSMLLELPPNLPGKPLPELSGIKTNVSPKIDVVPPSTVTSVEPDVPQPQHQEMRVRVCKETESDEILEVVEVEQQSELEEKCDPMEIGLEEIIANLEASENIAENLLQEEIVLTDTPSDSSSLFDSLLRSMDDANVKSIAAAQAVSQSLIPDDNIPSITEVTKVQLAKDESSTPKISETASGVERVHSIDEENRNLAEIESTDQSTNAEAAKLDEDLNNMANSLLESSDLQSDIVDIVEGQVATSTEEFDAKTLAEMEIIIMDKVQELENQDMKKEEIECQINFEQPVGLVEVGLVSEIVPADVEDKIQPIESNLTSSSKAKNEIIPERHIKETSCQDTDKPKQNDPEEPTTLDKFDEMVNEGLPQRKDGKPKESEAKVEKTRSTDNETILEEIVKDEVACIKKIESSDDLVTQDTLTNAESKKEDDNEKALEEVKVEDLEQKDGIQSHEPIAESGDVEEDRGVTSAQESNDEEAEEVHYTDGSSSKQETPRAETPLTETSDMEQTPSSIRSSYGRHTITPALDSVPNSPASVITDDEREYRVWKKAIMLVWSRIASHKYASLFLRPITDDQAPRYSVRVKRPIDLTAIKKGIETGATRNTVDFQRDILLMFLNAQMYNSSQHDVYNMARVMCEDSMHLIKDFVETQKLVQSAGEITALRRETRTTDALKRDDSDGPRTPLSFKRKRLTDLEKSPVKKAKIGDSLQSTSKM